ncbi:MAG: sigma-E factor negative regulatory protein [Pseudomonadota bacterium]
MNRNEQISAMLDGELDEFELKRLLESMEAEEAEAWQGYCAVGDLIRSSEMISFHSPGLVGRIAVSLESEPTVVAPVLAAKIGRQTALQRVFSAGRSRRLLASVAAVGFFSFALNQAIPPLDSQVQMVRTQAVENTFTDEELALWQEYFMAHQQNSIRGGLSAVSPIARVEADRPMLDNTERVIVGNSGAGEWMNVWEPSPHSTDPTVQFNYVSSSR